MDIDVVIEWVDGDDPQWKARCEEARGGDPTLLRGDVGGNLRFRQMREIDWCVASINRFAPFVRRIFVVTDRQNPHLERTVDKWIDNPIPVEIVDHSVIFRGYEDSLPVFNSRSIESVIHRIPALAEHYVLMNDDMFLMAPVSPEDWFKSDGCPVAYGKWNPAWALRLLRNIKPRKDGRRQVGFKDSMLKGADIVGSRKVLVVSHTPRPFLKSAGENLAALYPDAVSSNINHKFRSPDQYNTGAAEYLLLDRAHRLHVKSPSGLVLFLKPFANRPNYLRDHLKRVKNQKFGCINSIPMADPEDAKAFIKWISQLLDIPKII